jgi:phosphatidate cytidylyltransferase
MTPAQQTYAIFGGIGAILLLASAIGAWLRRRYGAGSGADMVENLNARIRAWWWMVGVMGAALLLGRGALIVLYALASMFALREFITITPTRRGDHLALFAGFFLVTPFQYLLVGLEWYGLFAVFIPVYAYLFLPVLAVLPGETRGFMERTAETQWGLMITVYCVSHVPALLFLDIPGYEDRNALLMIFLILVVQSSDVLQYVFGKLFGRTKVAPEVSPSKTVEGFVGGVASATFLGALLWWATPFSFWVAGAMAFAITLMGFLGGLVMSAIKRDRGVKDWGQMIEGHGGFLDRLDSVCFSAPVFFHLTRFFYAN